MRAGGCTTARPATTSSTPRPASQLGQSLDLIDMKLRKLLSVLLKRSEETKTLVCIGRTHGQQGVPTTYGLRFAIWASAGRPAH